MTEPRHTTYQRLTPSGTVHRQCVGAVFTPAGTNTFTVPVTHLHDMTPRAGDVFTTADGTAFTVLGVTQTEETYALACEPKEGGA